MTDSPPDPLGRLLDELPVRAAPVQDLLAAGRSRRCRRHRIATLGAVAVIVVALVGAATALTRSDSVDEVAQDPADAATTASPAAVVAGMTVDLPTSGWRPGDPGHLALGRGELGVDADGCVYLADRAGAPTYAVWPAGFTATLDSDGALTLLGPDGEVAARGGDQIQAGGGYRAPVAADGDCVPDTGDVFSIESTLTVTGSRADLQAMPDRVRVTCTDDGIFLSDTSVAARATGVVLVVDSTMAPGSSFTYDADGGPSGGETLTPQPRTWTLAFPPGQVELDCAPPGDGPTGDPATLLVNDPQGYWRAATVADAGCSSGSQPSWVAGLQATGSTPEQAVEVVLANLTRLLPATYAAEPAETGYVGAATQTWIATRDGVPHLTIDVTRRGSTYSAGPSVLCG